MGDLPIKTGVFAGELSYILENDDVRLAVSQVGGQTAPISFFRSSREPVEPYYISPWFAEHDAIPAAEPGLRIMRGDFLGFPFGAPETYDGKSFLGHGETSCRPWMLASASRSGPTSELVLTLETDQPPGRVAKRISLVDGHSVLYIQHRLAGFSGSFPVGHHAILAMPEKEHSVLVGLSDYRYGRTWPAPFGDPGIGSYAALAVDQRFDRLDRVPTAFKEPAEADYSMYPTGRGYTDGLMVFNNLDVNPAWTAATFTTERFLWFALKDPMVLPATLIWSANHGRHFPPWNGREFCLGLGDVRSYFALGGLASAAANPLNTDGIPTALELDPNRDTVINYIHGVARTPAKFGRVVSAAFAADQVAFRDGDGREVVVPVTHAFLRTGNLNSGK